MARARPRKMSFKKGSPAARKRSQIAEDIAAAHPGMPMASKMAIATTAVKRMKRRPA